MTTATTSNPIVNEPEVTAPVQDNPPVPPAPKFRKVIQPKDKNGNPIGQPHVYEGDSLEEVAEKMEAAIANGTQKIHELTREQRLGASTKPNDPPAELERTPAPVEFKPRQLTADEKWELSQKLRDPDGMDEAFDKLIEARFGLKPTDFAQQQATSAMQQRQEMALREANAFVESHPEYVNCPENSQAMITLIAKHNLAPTKRNFEWVYQQLLTDGLLVVEPPDDPAPAAATAPPAVPPRTEDVAPAPAPPRASSRSTADIPRALTRRDASSAASPVRPKAPTAAEIAMMSPAQLKKLYPELANAK